MRLTQLIWKHYREQLVKNNPGGKGQAPFFTAGNLVLIVTSRCNFLCKHCLRNFDSGRDLSLDIAKKALLGAKRYKFRHMSLTGGEPLVYPHLKELIEFAVNNGYKFAIVTNGYNLNEVGDLLKKYRPSISFIAFSLESVDKKKHDAQRREGSFERLLEDFQFCRKNKIPFRVLTAASLMNYDEIFDLALFAKKKGAQCLAVTTILPCPRSEDNKLVLDAGRRQELFLLLKQLPHIIKLPVVIAADLRAPGNIKLCQALDMVEITVDMDGNLVQCCELANFDSEDIRRHAIITSLTDKSFDDALKILSEHSHKSGVQRIEDFKTQADLEHIDFNSCFYCLRKLTA